MLENYFTYDDILSCICNIRAKIAKQRSKKHIIHLLTSDKKTNYHLNRKENNYKDSDLELLNSILPARRKWKIPNKKNRYINNHQKIDSIKYNKISLLFTIDFYKKTNPEEAFLKNLNNFIKEIQDSINDPNFRFSPPQIIPQIKNKALKKARPISLYGLKDRIIISLTNRYLSNFFDECFYEESHAFRPKRNYRGNIITTSHHNAIDSITHYKKNYKGKRLYVSECDISKFYDSVSHKVVKECFNKLVIRSKKEIDYKAKNIFIKYLESYSFVHNVKIYNDYSKYFDYWQKFRINNGYYGWIDKELQKFNLYRNIERNRIGVPQGGAISGFIANLVLHFVDIELLKYNDKRLHYVRFCDDMVILHPSKKLCEKYYKIYHDTLLKLKLVPHSPEIFEFKEKSDFKRFWSEDIKSKKPYKWSSTSNNASEWIGFVGYEISFSNLIRVRSKSLRKEKNKQRELVELTLRTLKNGQRKSKDTILESVSNRLIGMSVGRVTMKNFTSIENDFCWAKGFNRLSKNVHIARQLKNLDKYRNKQIYKLKKNLSDHLVKKDLFIPKFLFTCIPTISTYKSEDIRNNLVTINILTKDFKFNEDKIEEIKSEGFIMRLNASFMPFERMILKVLLSFKERDRNVNYYGKPFSYYYNLIDKNIS